MTTQYKPFINHGQYRRLRKSGWPTWATVVLAVVGGVMLVCGAFTAFALSLPDEPEVQRDSPTAPQAVEPAGDALEIIVVDTRTEENAIGDQFTAVEVEVRSVTDQRIYVGPLDWHVVDVNGFKHKAAFGPMLDDQLPGMYLNEGDATTGAFYVKGRVEVSTVVYQRWATDRPIEVPAS